MQFKHAMSFSKIYHVNNERALDTASHAPLLQRGPPNNSNCCCCCCQTKQLHCCRHRCQASQQYCSQPLCELLLLLLLGLVLSQHGAFTYWPWPRAQSHPSS
jgi:hypothetical protein